LDLVVNINYGEAAQLLAQTTLGGVSVIAEHRQYFRDFLSEQNSDANDPLPSRSTIRFDGVVRVTSLAHVPISVTGSYDRHQSGNTETKIDNRLSTAIGRASLSNTLSWQLSDANDTVSRTLDGTLLVGGSIYDIRLRGQTSYGVIPQDGFRNAAVTADWRPNELLNARTGVNCDLTEKGSTTFSAGVNAKFKYAASGFNVDYKISKEEINARVNLAFSLGYAPKENQSDEAFIRPRLVQSHRNRSPIESAFGCSSKFIISIRRP